MAVQDKGQVIHRPAKINRAQAKSCFFWSKKGWGEGGALEKMIQINRSNASVRACVLREDWTCHQ